MDNNGKFHDEKEMEDIKKEFFEKLRDLPQADAYMGREQRYNNILNSLQEHPDTWPKFTVGEKLACGELRQVTDDELIVELNEELDPKVNDKFKIKDRMFNVEYVDGGLARLKYAFFKE